MGSDNPNKRHNVVTLLAMQTRLTGVWGWMVSGSIALALVILIYWQNRPCNVTALVRDYHHNITNFTALMEVSEQEKVSWQSKIQQEKNAITIRLQQAHAEKVAELQTNVETMKTKTIPTIKANQAKELQDLEQQHQDDMKQLAQELEQWKTSTANLTSVVEQVAAAVAAAAATTADPNNSSNMTESVPVVVEDMVTLQARLDALTQEHATLTATAGPAAATTTTTTAEQPQK